MMTIAALAAIFSKFRPILDGFKDVLSIIKDNPKTVRTILEIIAIAYIVFCVITHWFGKDDCGTVTRTEYKDTTIYIPADTSKWITMIGDTTAYYEGELKKARKYSDRPEPTIPGEEDSCSYLLKYYKGQLALCDDDLTSNTRLRVFKRTLETDSFRLKYDVGIHGSLAYAPKFDVQHTFPSEKQIIEKTEHIYEPRLSRAIWIDGSIGPRLSYGSEISLVGFGGSIGAGYSDRKGYGYGVRASATNYDWAVEAVFRKSFQIERPNLELGN